MATRRGVEAGRAFVLVEAVDETRQVMFRIRKNLDKMFETFRRGRSVGLSVFNSLRLAIRRTGKEWMDVWRMVSRMTTAVNMQLKSIGRNLNRVGMNIRRAGFDILFGAGIAATPFIVGIRQAANFTDSLLALQAVLRPTEEEATALEAKIEQLGKTTSFTAKEVADAATELARGGFNAQQVIDSLQATLDLARGGQLDLAEASTILVRSLTAFGMEATEASRVADMLFSAATQGTATVSELAQSLSFSAGTAQELGLNLGQTVAILSKMANRMLFGTKGGTSLNQMLLELAANGEKLQEELGVETADAFGNFESPLQILMELNRALSDLPQAERVAKIIDLFNVRGGRAVLAANITEVLEATEEIESSFDAARMAAEKMDSGLGGLIRRTISVLDNLARQIGNAFEEPFEAAEATVLGLINRFADFAKANQKLFVDAAKVVAVVAGLGAVALVSGTAISALGTLFTFIGTTGAVAAAAITGITLQFGGLIAAIVTFGMEFRNEFRGALELVQPLFQDINRQVKVLSDLLKNELRQAWLIVRPEMEGALKEVLTLLKEITPFLQDIASISFASLIGQMKTMSMILRSISREAGVLLKTVGGITRALRQAVDPFRIIFPGRAERRTPSARAITKEEFGPTPPAQGTIVTSETRSLTAQEKGDREKIREEAEKLRNELAGLEKEQAFRLRQRELDQKEADQARMRRLRDLGMMQVELAKEADAERRNSLAERIKEEEDALAHLAEVEKLQAERAAEADLKRIRRRTELQSKLLAAEKELGEETRATEEFRRREATTSERVRAAEVNAEQVRRLRELSEQRMRLEERRAAVMSGASSFVSPAALQRGSVEAVQQAMRNTQMQRQVTLLGSIDSSLKSIKREEERTSRAIEEAVREGVSFVGV